MPTDLSSLPLRSGKWSQEESDYAELLVEHFRLGLLENELAPGATLRAFLSSELHCDGMRITKRYSGEDSMGKLVYSDARSSRTHVQVRHLTLATLHPSSLTFVLSHPRLPADTSTARGGACAALREARALPLRSRVNGR